MFFADVRKSQEPVPLFFFFSFSPFFSPRVLDDFSPLTFCHTFSNICFAAFMWMAIL